ncbi:zinc-binding dehydrogenase [Streptomyces dysideae]|uniref:Zinc-binding dehydrogenase n=1 Tax=Streptomyces dysideae TaxID=909626 RepID=A0A117S048_9ACTN|nr:zinc-binding dehydrogenase [Streptomyces dysideae]KUO19281.1 hypothetical protein AQJ91_20130 [Streptomyces dysideae]
MRPFTESDRVVAISESFGMHAEYVCVPQESAVTSKSPGLRPPREKTRDLVLIGELAGAGAIRPVIDRSHPLERAAEAHGYVDTGHKRGAVIVLASETG